MGCVVCHSKDVEQCWDIPIFSKNIRQAFNICGSCGSSNWSKFAHTPAFSAIIISSPKSPKEFEQLAIENNSIAFASSWCEYPM